MAQPVAYTPVTSFVSYQAQQPWFPGQNIDAELNALKATTDQIRTNLALIQRDDGSLSQFASIAIPAGGTAGKGFTFSTTVNFGVFFGSGAPTLQAAKGSLYLRSDGSSTSTRVYVNTDGATAWTNLVTAA
jgi:hypothetical protein